MEGLRKVNCIAAMDIKRGIGRNNALPWSLPKEFKYFEKITSTTKDPAKRNVVVMGKSTWLSIPDKFRPLRNRLNVVLSTTIDKELIPANVMLADSFSAALTKLSSEPLLSAVENVFIVGGAGVYREAMESGLCHRIYLTHVQGDYACTVFFPDFDLSLYEEVAVEGIATEVQQEKGVQYRFVVYEKKQAVN